jgi:bifunctional phosphoglucose/phosphomannose isomerase
MDINDFIRSLPHHITAGLKLGTSYAIPASYKRIIICGMGGSGIPGALLSVIDARIVSWHDFSLPSDVTADDAIVCISWSGHTAETLSAYHEAHERNLHTTVITKAQSELGKAAQSDSVEFIELPDEQIPPRFAVGYTLGALATLLGHTKEVSQLVINPDTWEQPGNDIAHHIQTKVPVVYVSTSTYPLGAAWKMLLNENAKIHADWNAFPELTHNELAEFSEHDANGYLPIVLKNSSEHEETNSSIDRTIAFMEELGYTVYTVVLSGSTLFEKVLNGYILGLWTSCALARNLGVDPLDTHIIEAFKKETQK